MGKNEKVTDVEEKDEEETGSTEIEAQPTSKVEALAPKATPETVGVSEEKPRWVILNEWTKCSRTCGKGMFENPGNISLRFVHPRWGKFGN